MSTTLTLRIDDALKAELESLSEATHRSKSFLAAEALARYVKTESWQITHIKDAISEAEGGGFVSDDDMDKWLASWGTDKQLPPPEVMKRTRG